MKLAIDICVAGLMLFWPIVLVTSVMMFGGGGSAHSKGNVLFVIAVVCYPIYIFLLYTIFGFPFFGLKSLWLLGISIVVVCAGLAMLGHFRLLMHAIRGVNIHGYTITPQQVYFSTVPIPDADVATFHYEDIPGNSPKNYYSKDKDRVYYHGKVLAGADPASFRKLEHPETGIQHHSYSADQTSVYYQDEKLAGASPDDFLFLSEYRGQSGNHFYEGSKKYPDVAPNFQFLSASYAKDDQHIYFDADIILQQADAKSFTFTDDWIYPIARDKNHVYLMRGTQSQSFPIFDVETFEKVPEATYYVRDKDNVYYFDPSTLEATAVDADRSQFHAVEYTTANGPDAYDGKSYFLQGRKIDK